MFLRTPLKQNLQNTAGKIHSYMVPRLVKTGVVNALGREQKMVSSQPAELHLFTPILTMHGGLVTDMVTGRVGGMSIFLKIPSQANLPSYGYLFVLE